MTDDSPAVVLVQIPTEWQAKLIAAVLQEEGIDAAVVGSLTAQFRAEAPGMVRIMVPEAQLQRARDVLEVHQREISSIDWSQVDLDEPER